MAIDVFPTLADILGADLPAHSIDGRSIWSVLRGGGEELPDRPLFFYYRQNELQAMRLGRWKLHFPHVFRSMEGRDPGGGGVPGLYDYSRATGLELYDLGADIGERRNLVEQFPEVVAELSTLADEARAELGDALTGAVGSAVRETRPAERAVVNRAPGQVASGPDAVTIKFSVALTARCRHAALRA